MPTAEWKLSHFLIVMLLVAINGALGGMLGGIAMCEYHYMVGDFAKKN